jgi:hypothetical protein
MNNEVITFRRFGRCYEFWDPAGSDTYIPFWESLYKNVSFNIVVYVIDARKYWSKEERAPQVVQDRMEIHNILCAPEFEKCQVWSSFIILLDFAHMRRPRLFAHPYCSFLPTPPRVRARSSFCT